METKWEKQGIYEYDWVLADIQLESNQNFQVKSYFFYLIKNISIKFIILINKVVVEAFNGLTDYRNIVNLYKN